MVHYQREMACFEREQQLSHVMQEFEIEKDLFKQ